MVLKAVMMACWQRPHCSPVILHSDLGTQFASADYQKFLKDHHLISSMNAVGDDKMHGDRLPRRMS